MIRPIPTFLVSFVLTVAFALQLPKLRFDNTPESWLPDDTPGMRSLLRFRERFGDGSFVLATMQRKGAAWDAAAWREVAQALRGVPGVAAVVAPPFAEEESEGPRAPVAAFLESEDGSTAALLIQPRDKMAVAEAGKLIERLEAYFARSRLAGAELAGVSVITHDLDRGSRESLATMGPLVALVLCVVLYATTRQWRGVAAALAVIVVESIWTLGLVAMFDRPLNLVLVTMPAILAVVTMTQTMHTLSFFHCLEADEERREAWRKTLRSLLRPSVYCSVSTAAGFFSLISSSISPVRDLGVFTAAGVMFSFVLCFTLFPALLVTSEKVKPRGIASQDAWKPEHARAFTSWIVRWRRTVLGGAVGLFALAVYGMTMIRVDSHILEFFPAQHRIPVNYRLIEEKLLGLTPIDVVFRGPKEKLLSAGALESYRTFFEKTLQEEPLARQVVSLALEPTRGKKLELVMSAEELREALGEEELPAGARAFLIVEGEEITLRSTVLARTASTNEVYQMMERIRARLETEAKRQGVAAEIGGATPLLIEGQVLLLQTQIESFAIAFAIVAATVLVGFRSLWAAGLILIPNLLPIAMTLGFMGWVGIPLNTATVTVAGIALGLIVDDSIHLYFRYRQCPSGLSASEAMYRTLLLVAKPVATTSLAIAFGFALFVFSPFMPTVYFGLLLAITATASLGGVLVLFPALLVTVDGEGRASDVSR